ncbi:MAG: MFS transporter [Chitinophagaceae bacterium]|nr:MFS transporter [Chitinophagaceae bacterium]
MLNRTIQLYRSAYKGLSPETWWLSLIMLINRSGTMVIPFLTIYLTSPAMGYSIGEAGIVMGLFGLGAVIGAHISGKLTDRIGFFPIQVVTLAGGGVLFIVLGQMNSYPLICLFTFLLSFVNEAFRPANSTAIAFYSSVGNRTRSYALNRLAINLGWAAGNAVGGFIASYDYKLLFWFDGITNILAAIFMWIFLSPKNNGKTAHKSVVAAGGIAASKDKIYVWFTLLVTLFAICFFQLFTNLPAYYRNELHFSERFIGLIGAVNGLMIAVMEMVIIFKLEGRRSSTYYITRGVMLCALAYLIPALFNVGHGAAISMIVLMTIGEIFSMPFMNSFWISRSSAHNRGEYAAMYTIAWASAQTIGPVAGAMLAQYHGYNLLWWAVGGLLIICTIGFAHLNNHLKKH